MPAETFESFPIRRETWAVAGESFDLIWHADMDALLDDPRTHERFRQDEYMPYWAVPWPSATLLADCVLREHRGSGRAIELGCGVGVVSLAAARAGWTVLATDYDADSLKFVEENARRNAVVLAGAALLDWRKPFDEGPFELVLASDVLYERRNVEPVAQWIGWHLAPGGVALVADSNRSSAEGFAAAAEAAGLAVEKTARELIPPGGLLVRGAIYCLRRNKQDSP